MLNKHNKLIKGLLTEFIENKIKTYQEPLRGGRYKGKPVKFSKPKYSACLYSLTNTPIKEQANKIEATYGLLRKWRTEDRFQQQARELSDEFAETFFNKITELKFKKGTTEQNHYYDFLKKSINQIEEVTEEESIFLDKDLYGELTLESIIETFIKKLDSNEKVDYARFEKFLLYIDIPTALVKDKLFSRLRHSLINRCKKNVSQVENHEANANETYKTLDFLEALLEKQDYETYQKLDIHKIRKKNGK